MKHKSRSPQEAEHESEHQQSHTESSTPGCFIHLRNQFFWNEHQATFRTKMKMRCMLLLFSKLFCLLWFFSSPWTDNKQFFVVEESPRQVPAAPCTTTEENLMSSCPRESTTSPAARTPPRADRADPGHRKAANWSCCSLGRLSHPQFYFTGVGSLAELSEDGYVLKGYTLHRGFACSLLDCKPARGCTLQEDWILPKLLLAPCCPCPTSR